MALSLSGYWFLPPLQEDAYKVKEYGFQVPNFYLGKSSRAGCLSLLAKLTGGALIPQVAAVLYCETLVSICDGKKMAREGEKSTPSFNFLLLVCNVFQAASL